MIRTVRVWKPVPLLAGLKYNSNAPWLIGTVELHLMGVERSMYRGDMTSRRHNDAVATEWLYRQMGLVLEVSMN
jgi:hypothetical protein